MWLACGGDATLESYGGNRGGDPDCDPVPEAHYAFMEQRCLNWYETDTHFFVHANVDARRGPEPTSPRTCSCGNAWTDRCVICRAKP